MEGNVAGREAPVVLVVEDEPAIASAVAHRMRAEGWQVETAADGLSGVAAAARLHPDVIVLDVMLPGMDGLEVCRRVQAERPVPVIMLTARDDETDMLVGLGRRRRRLPHQAVLHARAGGPHQGPAAPRRAGPPADRHGRRPSRPSSSATW